MHGSHTLPIKEVGNVSDGCNKTLTTESCNITDAPPKDIGAEQIRKRIGTVGRVCNAKQHAITIRLLKFDEEERMAHSKRVCILSLLTTPS
jgi:hypothetical protein